MNLYGLSDRCLGLTISYNSYNDDIKMMTAPGQYPLGYVQLFEQNALASIVQDDRGDVEARFQARRDLLLQSCKVEKINQTLSHNKCTWLPPPLPPAPPAPALPPPALAPLSNGRGRIETFLAAGTAAIIAIAVPAFTYITSRLVIDRAFKATPVSNFTQLVQMFKNDLQAFGLDTGFLALGTLLLGCLGVLFWQRCYRHAPAEDVVEEEIVEKDWSAQPGDSIGVLLGTGRYATLVIHHQEEEDQVEIFDRPQGTRLAVVEQFNLRATTATIEQMRADKTESQDDFDQTYATQRCELLKEGLREAFPSVIRTLFPETAKSAAAAAAQGK